MIRQSPDAVVLEHQWDPRLKSLYVEGPQDRQFLDLLALNRNPDAEIRVIDTVELPSIQGGNRERLVFFARFVTDTEFSESFSFFADRNGGSFTPESLPESLNLTDLRDLEGYVLGDECVQKLVVADPSWDKNRLTAMMTSIREVARDLAFLRLASSNLDLDLPFQDTDLRRSVSVSAGRIVFDHNRNITALLNKKRLHARKTELETKMKELSIQFTALPTPSIMHGKDAFDLFDAAMRATGSTLHAGSLWGTFDVRMIRKYPSLEAAVRFLEF
ncbi:MAG: hypothetical protein JW395_1932 [Nitrospira sp.]|nr:hypothetical protein [Nitrospira sp.]